MTISATTARTTLSAAGAGPYVFPGRILSADDLAVALIAPSGARTVLALGADYAVAGVGEADCAVTLAAPALTGQVELRLALALTQAAEYRDGDAFPAAGHEAALDKLTLIAQQQASDVEDLRGAFDAIPASAVAVVETAGNIQVDRVNSAGDAQVEVVGQEGDAVVATITAAGATQLSAVQGAGSTQIANIAATPGADEYASVADALSNGVVSVVVTAGGSSGANGPFTWTTSGGSGSGAYGVGVVTGGSIVSMTPLAKGRGYTTTTPSNLVYSVAGLTGPVTLGLSLVANQGVDSFFITPTPPMGFTLYRVDAGGTTATSQGTYPSYSAVASAISSIFSSEEALYVFGGQALVGITDPNNRALVAWLSDGVARGKFGLGSADGSLGVNYSASTGLTDFSVNNLSQDAAEYFLPNGLQARWIVSDSVKHVWAAGTADGHVYIPKLRADNIECPGSGGYVAVGSGYYFDVSSVSGLNQIFSTNKLTGIRTQFTSVGNNSSPQIDSSGGNLLYFTDRSGTPGYWFQPVVGGSERPVVPFKTGVVWGDSLSQTYLAPGLAALNLVVSNQGIGGERADEIAARATGAVTATVTGNSVPASGGVTVTNFVPTIFRRAPSAAWSFRASIGGVAGVLATANSGSTVTFTRESSGSAVGVSNPTSVTLLSGYVQNTTANGAALLTDLSNGYGIVWAGHNSYFLSDINPGSPLATQSGVLQNIADMVAQAKTLVQRVLVIGITGGEAVLTPARATTFGNGVVGAAPDDAHTEAFLAHRDGTNAQLAITYAGHFFDMMAYEQSIGQTESVTPGAVPRLVVKGSWFTDGTHPGASAAADLSAAVKAVLLSNGWI
jgi:hypothetical protein